MTVKDFLLGRVLPWVLPAKTLDRALSVFSKAISELEAVEAAAAARASTASGKISVLTKLVEEERKLEADAAAMGRKLRDIFHHTSPAAEPTPTAPSTDSKSV